MSRDRNSSTVGSFLAPPSTQSIHGSLNQSRNQTTATGKSPDRRRLAEFIASTNLLPPTNQTNAPSIAVAATTSSMSIARPTLYASALTQLATELAKIQNIGWEKLARLAALCPPVPPVHTHQSTAAASHDLTQLWTELTTSFQLANDSDGEDDSEIEDEGDDADEADQASSDSDEKSSNRPTKSSVGFVVVGKSQPVVWEYAPNRIAITESNTDTLDTRIDAIYALARYLILAHAESHQTPIASHVNRLLPVLLRFLVSLPYFHYDTLNFPSITPKVIAQTLVSLLSELATQVPITRKYIAVAITLLLKQVSTVIGAAPSKDTPKKIEQQHYAAVLEGLLFGLSDTPFPFTATGAAVISEEYHRLFLAKYTMAPNLYGALLRAKTSLLAHHPEVYTAERLKYLFEHEFMRCAFQYPATSNAPGSRKPSGSSASTASTSSTAAGEAIQTMILVQTINLGVLVGLISNSRPTTDGIPVNCSEAEELSFKERALSKLKEMLDQLLNVHIDQSAVSGAAHLLVSPSSGSSSTSTTASVVVGCVDAARALLNGVMELANKYASDHESIPHIVDAIKTILLSSRRLSIHPKEKQLRYLLTISISKIFKLELLTVQQHSSIGRLHRSASQESLVDGNKNRSSSTASVTTPTRHNLSLIDLNDMDRSPDGLTPTKLIRSSSNYNLNNQSSSAIQFSNSFTRNFVQNLLAQMYKDELSVELRERSASNDAAAATAHVKQSVLYQRILVLLMDLVSLIDYAPLTQLVLPTLISRLMTRPKYLHLIIPQLTDIAIMEEHRYAQTNSRQRVSVSSVGHQQTDDKSLALSSALNIFDGILHLLLHAYTRSGGEVDASGGGGPGSAASGAASKKTMIEIPTALLRLSTEIESGVLKSYVLKRMMKLILDLSLEIRQEEFQVAQALAEQAKRKKKSSSKESVPSPPTINRVESCGFLLPILATLIKDCYLEQVKNAANSSTPVLGLQLYSNPESNAKWFRRLWFFLTSFHLTDGLVAAANTTGSLITNSNPSLSSSSDHWSSSIKIIALYSPVLINPLVHVDYLSTELNKEYESIAFKKILSKYDISSIPSTTNSSAQSSSDKEASEKIITKMNAQVQESYRRQVIALFPPTLSYDVNQLPIGRVLFLLSVFHLETIRVRASCEGVTHTPNANNTDSSMIGSRITSTIASFAEANLSGFHSLFVYLGHYPLNRMGLLKFISSLGDHLFNLISTLIFHSEATPKKQIEMETIIIFLLKQLASRRSIDRTTAKNFLARLTKEHVHLQWNTNCLSILLEIVQIVQETLETNISLQHQQIGCGVGSEVVESLLTTNGQNEIMLLKASLDLPDDLVQRRDIHMSLLKLASSWLDQAKSYVPDHTNLVVQEFIQRCQRNLPRSKAKDAWHTSFMMILQGALTNTPSAGIGSRYYDPLQHWSNSSLSHLIGELNVKERYLGEIKGLYRSYQESADRKRREYILQQQQLAQESIKPNLGSMRSMSVLIQQESVGAFQNLLARKVRTTPQSEVASNTAGCVTDGLQIPPFGKLLTAKLILEGNQILSTFHSIHAPQLYALNHTHSDESPEVKATKKQELHALHQRFERLLCLTAALLIWSTHGAKTPDLQVDAQDLLHLLVKTPSQLFTAESIETSVFVWQWILQAERSFELPLMIEMKAAWAYTVDRQVGLFSHRRSIRTREVKQGEKKLPLAQQREPSPSMSPRDSPRGTDLTLDSEPKLLASSNSKDHNNPAVTVQPSADGTLKTGAAPNLVQPSLVVEGGAAAGGQTHESASSHDAALHSFQSYLTPAEVIAPHLSWVNFLLSYFTYLPSFSRDLINILASILHKSFARPDLLNSDETGFGCRFRLLYLGMKLIQSGGGADSTTPSLLDLRDKQLLRARIYLAALNWFQNPPAWYDPKSPAILAADVDILFQFLNTLKKEDEYWKEITPGEKMSVVEDLSYPLGSQGPTANSATLTASSKNRLDSLTKQRNLLVFLLSHELDRIYVWHSPLTPSGLLPPQNTFTTHRGIYATEWKTLISTAWNLNPKLCVKFCLRFQQSAIVLSEITQLVQANPSAVYELPEAVVYLVTDDVLKKSAAAPNSTDDQLKHLIYWSPTTLPIAIWFLGLPFCSNRLVLEYAVHTLRSHPPENVMFYLSQILQCLRHDSEDSTLYRFLLESSKASVLLSHQLLWLAQAELGEVKATTKFVWTPFRTKVAQLIQDVIAGFDEVEQTFFKQEFEFFEQITAISGILKPLPTKQERKDKIKQELLKIEKTTANIYLPTNPQLQVVDIICTSGTPMQSAAKVPILVAFKVKVGDLDLSNERRQQQLNRLRALTASSKSGEPGRNQLEIADGQNADGADGPKMRVRINGVDGQEYSANNNNPNDDIEDENDAVTAAAEAESAEVSRLENEEIELLVDPEMSVSQAGISQQMNTAMARDRATKLAAAKSTADSDGVMVQACIFKVGDDCRQDALALQVIQWCKNIMQANGLELFLYPYRVLPNRTGGDDGLIGGIIECVPNASTRDEIGKSNAVSLLDHFINKFGPPESASFQAAQRNFIVSCAGYAITSYILQVKDRHNGNVMIDDSGHMIHIDFGFIFDISPARNMKFESAGFKLTLEMVELMGSDGKTASPLVHWFQELVLRGFLAVREHRAEILAIVEPMLGSTLECFKPNSLSGLKARFFPDVDEKDAAVAMLAIVNDAWNKWTTNVYDMIQKAQQNVFFFPGTSASDPEKRIKPTQVEEE